MNRFWIIPIGGFTQDLGRPTGMERLWTGLLRYSGKDVRVHTPLTWDSDWEDRARFVYRNSTPDVKIIILAYSWGAGWGFQTFSRELQKLGLEVSVAVLADPVYRSKVLPSWIPANPLSLWHGYFAPKIVVSPNVKMVFWTRQEQNLPRAHEVVAEDPLSTVIANPPLTISADHSDMDDHETYHELVRMVVRDILE